MTEPEPDMIERVKAALQGSRCSFGYSIKLVRLVDGVSTYRLVYDDAGPFEFDSHEEASRHVARRKAEVDAIAAIRAMREPTPAMRAALPLTTQYDEGFFDDYQKMIDAALTPSPRNASEGGPHEG